MKNHNGNLIFDRQPQIVSYASVVGKKEEEGPLREYFDRVIRDSYAGKDTFEQAESELLNNAVSIALNKAGITPDDVDIACCGDLLNQCVASSFAMRPFGIPYAGVYGACSTMALGMILAAITLESGAARRAVCAASSHYCTAERQYRFPLEYGSQRPPTSQWTVTGAGACVLEIPQQSSNSPQQSAVSQQLTTPQPPITFQQTATSQQSESVSHPVTTQQPITSQQTPYLYAARIGKILDYNVTDQNNMGAAMAPANVK